MAVMRSPECFSSRPIELLVMPFPKPLTTPPVTITYFMAAEYQTDINDIAACV